MVQGADDPGEQPPNGNHVSTSSKTSFVKSFFVCMKQLFFSSYCPVLEFVIKLQIEFSYSFR